MPEWRRRLVCSQRGSRNIDMVVTGTERRDEAQSAERRAIKRRLQRGYTGI